MRTPDTVEVTATSFPTEDFAKTALNIGAHTQPENQPDGEGLLITARDPKKEDHTVKVFVESVECFNQQTIPMGKASQEKLGGIRLGFHRHNYPHTSPDTVSNFVLDGASIDGDSIIAGTRNIVRGSARVVNSALWGENLLDGEAVVAGSHVDYSSLTDRVFFAGGSVFDSKLGGDVAMIGVNAKHVELVGNIEINAEDLKDGELGVHALRYPACLIPGNSERIVKGSEIDFSDLSLASRGFHVYDGDLWDALPDVRMCFSPEEHRKNVIHCHCLLWLPLILIASPLALHYLMRVSDLQEPLKGFGGSWLSREERARMEEVRDAVRDKTVSNPLMSLSLHMLEESLMKELHSLDSFNSFAPEWRKVMRKNLEVLGVTDAVYEKLATWKWGKEGDIPTFARFFTHLTGIRMGRHPVKFKI